MSQANQKLMLRLQSALNLSKRRVQELVQESARVNRVTRDIAALIVAGDNGISYDRYATEAQMQTLRGVPVTHAVVTPPTATAVAPVTKPAGKRLGKAKIKATKDNSMFVVHGRDAQLNQDMYLFLASIGIVPMEWDHAIKAAKGGANPIVGDVISNAMSLVQGVMVLFSPDEEAKIRTKHATASDKKKNLHLKGFQPRPNVIFEAGLALGAHSDKTILVQVGDVREISDIAGRHMVYLDNSFAARKRLADRLQSKLKFKIDLTGEVWQKVGKFDR